MLKRTISSAILVVLMIGLLISGGWIMLVGFFAMSLIGLHEFYHALQKGGFKPFAILGMVAAAVYYGLIYLCDSYVVVAGFFPMYLAMFFASLMAAGVAAYPKRSITDVALTFAGVMYVPILFSFLYFLREWEDGIFYVWYAFLASWGCDTCAYLVGCLCGKHKMSPNLSPKKTVEGLIGGVVGAIVVCMIYAVAIQSHVRLGARGLYILSFFVGLFGALLGQLGDLFASALKRITGIKDYGNLIPGHGGILDRFDSTLLVGPVAMIVFYLIQWLIR